jgi:uncharacterized RmlC-like cupin family protein
VTTAQKTLDGHAAVCRSEDDLVTYEGTESRRWNGPIRTLTVHNMERGINVRMSTFRPGADYLTPRHKHTTTHVRYVVSGTMNYGDEKYVAGDCMIIPDSVPYGPIMPSEGGDLPVFLQTTFMGPSGIPLPPPEELMRARSELRRSGEIADGIYRPHSGPPQDATEAAVEWLTGRKSTYPEPRVSDYTVVHAPNVPWVPVSDGVQVKHLAYMFETGPNVKLVRLRQGAAIPAGLSRSQQARYVIEGSIRWNGEAYDAISTMYYPAGCDYPESVGASESAIVLVIQWVNAGDNSPPFLSL